MSTSNRAHQIRILINDYGGHAFPVELSRELARRGHEVLHVYSVDDQTPKGNLLAGPADPPTFAVETVSVGEPLQKYNNLPKRRRQERAYGRLVCRRIDSFRPAVVFGSNNPLEAQNLIGNHCRRHAIRFVFWLQDIHSVAIRSFLARRSALVGAVIGGWYERMERRLLHQADHIVAIADTFVPQLTRWNIDPARLTIIENWAPQDKISVLPRDNPWRRAQGLSNKRVALYTGTIGLKHNPELLLTAAEAFRNETDIEIVVVSDGKYANYLRDEAARRQLAQLRLLPFQPFEAYSEVLASGDVLIAMIETDAASYSVPSKVLSYLCAGRPIVLAADEHNLAARTVQRSGAGRVTPPGDPSQFIAAIREFLGNERLRSEAGASGRRYADAHFDIALIGDRFERICRTAPTAGADLT